MAVIGAGAATAGVKRISGLRLDPYGTHNFLVEIEGLIAGGFTEAAGLTIETEVERRTFGGVNDREYTFVKGTKYTDLTLKRGMTDIDLIGSWYDSVIKGKIERKNGSVYLLNHVGLPVMWWDFYEAFPIKWEGPAFNSSQSTVAVETLVLSHNGLSMPQRLLNP